MLQDWVENYLAHRSFPEVGQKQKTQKKCTNSMQEAVLECRLPKSGTNEETKKQSHIWRRAISLPNKLG